MKHDCRYGGLVVSDCFKFPLRTKLKGRNRSLGGMLAKFQPHSSSFGCFEPGANSPAAAAYGESAPAPGNFVPLTFSRASAFVFSVLHCSNHLWTATFSGSDDKTAMPVDLDMFIEVAWLPCSFFCKCRLPVATKLEDGQGWVNRRAASWGMWWQRNPFVWIVVAVECCSCCHCCCSCSCFFLFLLSFSIVIVVAVVAVVIFVILVLVFVLVLAAVVVFDRLVRVLLCLFLLLLLLFLFLFLFLFFFFFFLFLLTPEPNSDVKDNF